MISTFMIVGLTLAWASPEPQVPREVRVPLTPRGEIDLGEVVARLGAVDGRPVARPPLPVTLPINGPAGLLACRLVAETLGPGVSVSVRGRELVIEFDPALLGPGWARDWPLRLNQLSALADREARRRLEYGMSALASYRPNDRSRPTICLVHGLNSSSGGFVHMIRPLEEAGFGVVVYDYAFNRPLGESGARFCRDWREFRRARGETLPWAIVAHSMGALVARAYVEDPKEYAGDVSSLILIAPPNQGSSLAKTQGLLQMLNSMQAMDNKAPAAALASLGDGLGAASGDILPGSAFLNALNRRPRAPGVAYHILAGDAGFIPPEARRRIESQIRGMKQQGGLLAGLTLLIPPDVPDQLDELCDGTGDGCVSVDRTRLEGVTDHVTVHANHAELIRAPLFFRDPGPVVCLPYILRWLNAPVPPAPDARAGGR